MVALWTRPGLILSLGLLADGARISRKRKPTAKPSLHYSKLSLHYAAEPMEDPELINLSGVAAAQRQEAVAEIARRAAEGVLAEEAAAAAMAARPAQADAPPEAIAALTGQETHSGGHILLQQGMEEASHLLTEVEEMLVASEVGCFNDGDSRLGCLLGCPCHWYQRCYPRYVEGVPPNVLASLNATVEGEPVNAGRCGLGVILMTLASFFGFLLLVMLIVVFRAAALAMAAVKEQAAEASQPGQFSHMLKQLRAEQNVSAQGMKAQTSPRGGDDTMKGT